LLLLPGMAGGVWVLLVMNQPPFTSTGLVACILRPNVVTRAGGSSSSDRGQQGAQWCCLDVVLLLAGST
jgi:hypothetical protein